MAGPQKRRQLKERKDREASSKASGNGSSSNEKSSPSPPDSGSPTSSHSPPTKFDGNRDPARARSDSQSSQPGTTQVAPSTGGSLYTNKNIEVGGAGQGLMAGVSTFPAGV